MDTSIICVTTLCGRIEPSGIGSALDRARLEEARANTGASLLGAGSLRKSDPEMRGPQGIIPETRIRALITETGNIPTERKIFYSGPRPIIFTSSRGLHRLIRIIPASMAEVVPVPHHQSGGLSLRHIQKVLRDRGVKNMLIEGGGKLNYTAIKQNVVNEILLTLSPRITGKSSRQAFVSGEDDLGDPFINFDLIECRHIHKTHELFLTYRRRTQVQAP